jgi:hypothetical protein
MASTSSSSSHAAHAPSHGQADITVKSIVRERMGLGVHDQDPYEILKLCFVYLHSLRQHVLQPLAGEWHAPMQVNDLTRVWESKIERQIIHIFGPAAQADAPTAAKTKSCGPILTALLQEWKTKIYSAGGIKTIADACEAFASKSIADWMVRWVESLHPDNVSKRERARVSSREPCDSICSSAPHAHCSVHFDVFRPRTSSRTRSSS